ISAALQRLRIQHLKLIEIAIDLGSLHKAARALKISQPRASAMLNEVESALGKRLFERTRKGVTLNSDGVVAVARLRGLLHEIGMFSHELRPEPSRPLFRIGVVAQAYFRVLKQILPPLLTRLDCRLELIHNDAPVLAAKLMDGELDCMLGV